jgi:hypothetical protein
MRRDASTSVHTLGRWTLATTFFLVVAGIASSAFALDAYEDRRGVFGGLSIGAGAGSAASTPDSAPNLDSGYGLGFHGHGVLGGGITESVTAAADLNWWVRSVRKGEREYSNQHISALGTANFYILDNIQLLAGAGFGYGIWNGDYGTNDENFNFQELGFAAKVGAGYEFWLNGNTALNFNLSYARHFYPRGGHFDTASGLIGLRWY